MSTYLENNPDVFLVVNYYQEYAFDTMVGELVVSDVSGVLTPFASDGYSSFYRTNSSSVSIGFSKNENTMRLVFDPKGVGTISINSSVNYLEYINDIRPWDFLLLLMSMVD
jgi:hypothetical protein